jgi:sulfatase-modifying factor enzyme 1
MRSLLRVNSTVRNLLALLPPGLAILAVALAGVGDAKANDTGPTVSAELASRGSIHMAARFAGPSAANVAAAARPAGNIAAAVGRPSANILAGSSHHRGGTFRVIEGSLRAPVEGAVCPPEMANVDNRFCVDRWEGSLVEVLPDGAEQAWPPYGPLDEGHHLRAVSRANVYPQAYISGAQAAEACASAGKRLCAPVEWRKACVGPQDRKFGYGNERVAGRCNDRGQSPMMRLYPQVARSWKLIGMTEMNDPRLNQLDGTLAPTGAHDECTNGYGVYDMVGNLHEWTSDPNGTFQGGYYLDTHLNGDGCSYRTVAHEFTYHDYSTGFRCCADPGEE